MNYKFLFDYDGVLTHKIDFAKSFANRYAIEEQIIRGFFQKHLSDCLVGKSDMLALLNNDLDAFQWSGDAAGLLRAIYLEDHHLNQEVLQLIRTKILGKSKVYLATNQEKHRLKFIKHEDDIQSLFSEIYGSCNLGFSKPDQAYFKSIFEQLQKKDHKLIKQQIVFIDDLKENVLAAESFGFIPYWFQNKADFAPFLEQLAGGKSFPILLENDLNFTPMYYADAKAYSTILSEEGTYHFLSDSGPKNEDQAIQKIHTNRQSTLSGQSIYWSIRNMDQVFLGFIAIHGIQTSKVAISYGIHPNHRRQGIASKALKVVLALDRLKSKTIELATHLENQASYQLLSKMHLAYTGTRETKAGKRHVFAKKW